MTEANELPIDVQQSFTVLSNIGADTASFHPTHLYDPSRARIPAHVVPSHNERRAAPLTS